MSKYTKEQVISERKCGLSKLDKALTKTTMESILENTIKYAKDHRGVWGGGWPDVEWAFTNSWREVISYHGPCAYNLDEALSPDKMEYIAQELGLNTSDYTANWKRKIIK